LAHNQSLFLQFQPNGTSRVASSSGLQFLLGSIVLAAALASLSGGPVWAISVTVLGLLALSVLAHSTIAVNACLLLALPYACGTYVGALLGVTFYPRPPLMVYEAAAVEQSLSLLIVAAVACMTGISKYFQYNLQRATKDMLDHALHGESSKRISTLAKVVAVGLGLHDLGFVVLNFSAITSSGRHAFRDEFWVANGPFGIVIALMVSATLALDAANPSRRWQAMIPLVLMWLPTLLAGGRNYLSVTAISVAAVLFTVLETKRAKSALVAALILGIYGFAIVPTLWSENSLVWLNEWILPNSLFLPLFAGLYSLEGAGVTGFWQQSALLLPSGLRPTEIVTYSQLFQSLGFTNVGVGGSPWASLFADSRPQRLAYFSLGTLSVFLVSAVGSRVSPMLPALTIGLMAFWGRSSYWNTMFIIFYVIVISVLLARVARARKFDDAST
jgi:hypothetical protein